MQKLGSLKNIVQEKVTNISSTISTKIKNHSPSDRVNGHEVDEEADHIGVQWHDFTIKELLTICRQQEWHDGTRDLTAVLLTLSQYGTIAKSPRSQPVEPTETDDDDTKMGTSDDMDEAASPLSVTSLTANGSDTISMEHNVDDMELSGQQAIGIVDQLRGEFECDICLECYVEPLTVGMKTI